MVKEKSYFFLRAAGLEILPRRCITRDEGVALKHQVPRENGLELFSHVPRRSVETMCWPVVKTRATSLDTRVFAGSNPATESVPCG